MPLLDSHKKYPMQMPDGTIIKHVVHFKTTLHVKDLVTSPNPCIHV